MAILKQGNGLVRWITAITAGIGISFAAGGYVVNEITFRAAIKQALPEVARQQSLNEEEADHLKEIDRRISTLTRNTCRLLIVIYAQKGWPIPEDCEIRDAEDIHRPRSPLSVP